MSEVEDEPPAAAHEPFSSEKSRPSECVECEFSPPVTYKLKTVWPTGTEDERTCINSRGQRTRCPPSRPHSLSLWVYELMRDPACRSQFPATIEFGIRRDDHYAKFIEAAVRQS